MHEHEAIEAAQQLANETKRKQNVVAILHMEEDGYSEVEYEITEEDVFDGPNNWLVKTLEPKKEMNNMTDKHELYMNDFFMIKLLTMMLCIDTPRDVVDDERDLVLQR